MEIFTEAIHPALLLGPDTNRALTHRCLLATCVASCTNPTPHLVGAHGAPLGRAAGYLPLRHLLSPGNAARLIPRALVLWNDAFSYQMYFTHPEPLGTAEPRPTDKEVAAGCGRAGFGLGVPASKTHLLSEIPA